MKSLALDIGSSSIKGAILDRDRSMIQVVASRAFPAPLAELPARHFEIAPEAVERAVREVLDELLRAAADAERLYCSSQMGGLVLVDAAGKSRSNYLSWRDQRTRSEGEGSLGVTRERLGCETLATLGNELQPGSTLALLSWFAQRGLLDSRVTPITIGEYVMGRLCGTPPRMHVTQAVGLLDLTVLDWSHEAFDRLGLSDLSWPRLDREITPCGEYAVGACKLEVFGAYGDQQCALYGAELAPGELSINVSTGAQVSTRVVGRPDRTTGRFQTRPYFAGELLQTVTHLPAGRSLNSLVDLLSELAVAEGIALKDPWGTIGRLVDSVAGEQTASSGLDVDLAFFAGPFGETGAVRGITTENLSVGQLFDAAFRSMAENCARAAEWLATDQPYRGLVLSGALARRVPRLRYWLQRQFGIPMRVAEDEETLLGLLALARQRQSLATATIHQ